MLRIFGCLIFAHVNDGKLGSRAVKCMFLGYASESKEYQMWCPDSKKVIQSRDVTFNKHAMLSSGKESVVSSANTCDQKDASRKVEIELETGAAQGGALELLIIPAGKFRLLNPVLVLQVLINLRWRMIIPYPVIVLEGRSGILLTM